MTCPHHVAVIYKLTAIQLRFPLAEYLEFQYVFKCFVTLDT